MVQAILIAKFKTIKLAEIPIISKEFAYDCNVKEKCSASWWDFSSGNDQDGWLELGWLKSEPVSRLRM